MKPEQRTININPLDQEYGTEDALAFLEGHGLDGAGRNIREYFLFDMDKWEECHNHVQWAFPSHIPSRFNFAAPVVNMEEFSEKLSPQGHVNVFRLMTSYLESLGFTHDKAGWHACMDWNNERVQTWVTPYNHNYQRISRLLNLLSWLNPDLALELLGEFLNVAEEVATWTAEDHMKRPVPFITTATVVYWSKAAIGKL